MKILLIDDNRDDRALAIYELKRAFPEVQVTEVGTAVLFARALTNASFDAVITDYQLHWSDGISILKTTRDRYPDCPVIMFTNTATQEIAIEAMKSGLDDYVIKSPSHYVRLPAAVQSALERVAAKQQAASLQARVQSLLNQLNIGIYRLTLDGALLEGNAPFLRLLRLDSLTEIPPNHRLEAYFQPQDYAELLAQLKQNGEVRDREIQIRCADGTTRWVKISKTFTKDNGNTIIDGLMEDITERKQAETLAEIEKQRSQFLAEASRLLTSSLESSTTLKNLANLAVPKLADICLINTVEPTTLVFGEPIVAASEPEQAATILKLKRDYPSLADANYGSVKVLRTGQSELRSHISNSVLEQIARDNNHLNLLQQLGIKASIVVPMIFQDRKFGTIALVKTKAIRSYDRDDVEMAEELARRTAMALDNARLYQEARQANKTKDEFLAIVSHELRNPLNSMLGWSQLLRKRQYEDQTLKQGLEIIERNARLQKKLIEDLLDVSRIIQNQLEISREPVDLVPIINAAIDSLQPNAKNKEIQISSNLDSSTKAVLGDAYRLEQIVGNLLSNAIKFTKSGERVEVRLQQVDALAQIIVTDTGQGISADFLPFIFERFRQADVSKTRAQSGLGLGLAIVRHLVELHEGNVYATSAGIGKGTTFTVQLPTLEPSIAVDSVDSNLVIESQGFSNLADLKVLVIDDDLDNRELIAFILAQQQIQVTIAASAAEGFEIVSNLEIDILISDIGMPDEDGYSLLRRIRTHSNPSKCSIPAIALTAFAKEENRLEAIASGFQRHLSKPINPDRLIEVVASLARQRL